MALKRLWHIHKDITIALWEMTESTKDLQNMLSIYNFNIPNFKSESRLKEWMSARVLCKQLLNSIQIDYTLKGKPFLLSGQYNISISHSSKYLVLAFSKNHFLGIDIQQTTIKTIKVLNRFTTEAERAQINNSIEKASLVWAAKEALYKLSFTKPTNYAEQLQVNMIGTNFLKTQIFDIQLLSNYLTLEDYYIVVASSINKIT